MSLAHLHNLQATLNHLNKSFVNLIKYLLNIPSFTRSVGDLSPGQVFQVVQNGHLSDPLASELVHTLHVRVRDFVQVGVILDEVSSGH